MKVHLFMLYFIMDVWVCVCVCVCMYEYVSFQPHLWLLDFEVNLNIFHCCGSKPEVAYTDKTDKGNLLYG